MIRVLLIGQKPETVDFSDPTLPFGSSVDAVRESVDTSLKALTDRGWHVDLLLVAPGDTVEREIDSWIRTHDPYHCVVIGADIRLPPRNLRFFETVINTVHRYAPSTAIAFPGRPGESADSVLRWLRKTA